jgi:ADP-ribose pyrophosphatase
MSKTQPWKLIGQRPGPSGWIEVTTNTYRMPDGSEADWDIMSAADSVAIVALTDTRQIVLARQFRPGPACVLDELPGGELGSGETPLQAAIRELAEETGYQGRMTVVGHTWQGANIVRRKWAAVATECTQVAEPVPDPSEEFCETLTVSLDDFRSRLRSGQITDGWAGYVGLDHLGELG